MKRARPLYSLPEYDKEERIVFGCLFASLIGLVVSAAAWGTSVVVNADHHAWGRLIVFAVLFPAGIVHGFGVWVGAWT